MWVAEIPRRKEFEDGKNIAKHHLNYNMLRSCNLNSNQQGGKK
jgi:hypothetical protein